MTWLPYSRVEMLLPCNDEVEREALNAVVRLILDRFGGATASEIVPPVFTGYYRGARGWVEDQVVLVIADTESTIEEDTRAWLMCMAPWL